jgi:diketogulonate reductase-like aldo/keto reductase
MAHNTPTITLRNDTIVPQIGLGVWQAADGDEVESAVLAALNAGYRMIDTASVYGNEAGVGRAIKKSGIDRSEIFITTKLWNSDQGYHKTLAAFDESLRKLDLDYIDLYLIHWPTPARGLYKETWKAFEKLYADGHVKAIGVSNFHVSHLDDLLTTATVVPMVNQIELHPYLPQHELREYGKLHNIAIESWSPIGGSGGSLLSEPILSSIGSVYNKSPAQIVIRWHIQNGLIVIPKSVHQDRITQNFDVFDFHLSHEDMESIDHLQNGKRTGPNPDTANFH